MKLIIIRHGDPDYSIDSLTPPGWEEAQLLAERISKLDVTAFYVSPLGRAQDTAAATLKKMGRTAETLDWLREFPARIVKEGAHPLSGKELEIAEPIIVGEGRKDCYLYLGEVKCGGNARQIASFGLDLLSGTPEGTSILDGIVNELRRRN